MSIRADEPQDGGPQRFPNLFSPIQIGAMTLPNRVMLPPHASAVGNIFGSPKDFDKVSAYCERRAKAGVAWFDTITGGVAQLFIPGFEHAEASAQATGTFRLSHFIERVSALAEMLHGHGAYLTGQMNVLGGMPHAPSPLNSQPGNNLVPHVLTTEEIAWFVREYGYSATRMREAGMDGVEIHMNHEDLTQWFLSPHTNRRTDAYGGSVENRARFIVEALTAIREAVGDRMTVGVRMNMDEPPRRGYDVKGGIEIARHIEASGLIDYLHAVEGSTWGAPSYIQPHLYAPAQWAEKCGRYKAALSIPVLYSGIVNSADVAEQVLAAGFADAVGMARAFIADPDILVHAREGRARRTRPCVGGAECINRVSLGLSFGCAVNPHAGFEADRGWRASPAPRRVLVLGGGPAGLEVAGLCRERGHEVVLWEKSSVLGGQLAVAARAPGYARFADFLEWQTERLQRLGVRVEREREADVDAVLAQGADVVIVATGAKPYRPAIEGADGPGVFDIQDVLTGRAAPGRRVVIVAHDDHMPPLALADFLAERGRTVTLIYGAQSPGRLISKYMIGAPLARLDTRGVVIRCMEDVTRIGPSEIEVRNVYSERRQTLTDFDTVVLACGAEADSALYYALKPVHPEVHVLGDAFAPRRLDFATKQARALAARI
jgi:2,4-dienoyl-CoA reductase-like NADH-dependent reductase (Old Yellow Enzyme family)/pyruvate/2-oxoglutarate dehydrogenase complex dihydrolipoamide dehydrogenase (E3) component